MEDVKENSDTNAKSNELTKEIVVSNIITDITDIFIKDTDTFDVSISFYKTVSGLVVETVDEAFSKENPSKTVSFSLKYPGYGDISKIYSYANRSIDSNKFIQNSSLEKMNVREFLQMEFARFICLLRGWSILKQEATAENIMKIDPKIIRAVLNKIREKINNDGLI